MRTIRQIYLPVYSNEETVGDGECFQTHFFFFLSLLECCSLHWMRLPRICFCGGRIYVYISFAKCGHARSVRACVPNFLLGTRAISSKFNNLFWVVKMVEPHKLVHTRYTFSLFRSFVDITASGSKQCQYNIGNDNKFVLYLLILKMILIHYTEWSRDHPHLLTRPPLPQTYQTSYILIKSTDHQTILAHCSHSSNLININFAANKRK